MATSTNLDRERGAMASMVSMAGRAKRRVEGAISTRRFRPLAHSTCTAGRSTAAGVHPPEGMRLTRSADAQELPGEADLARVVCVVRGQAVSGGQAVA